MSAPNDSIPLETPPATETPPEQDDSVPLFPAPAPIVRSASVTLHSLIHPVPSVSGDTPIARVWDLCKELNQEFLPVVDEGRLVGLCSLAEIGLAAATAQDITLFIERPIRSFLLPDLVTLSIETPVAEAIEMAFKRQGSGFFQDLAVIDVTPEQPYLGLIALRTLIELQSHQIIEQLQALEKNDEILRNSLALQFRHSVEMRRSQRRDHQLQEELRNAAQQQFRTSMDLRRSQARYQILFQNSAVGVALITNSGETETYNRHFASLIKVPLPDPAAPPKIDLGDFMPLSARAEFLSTLQRLEGLPESAPPLTLELPMEIEGQQARFRVTMSWIAESSQVCLCAVDVTEERNLQKKIMQQEKDVLLDSLLGGIAHELNNKALPLLGFSELLSTEATDGRDPAKIAQYTEVIKKSSAEFAAVVHQLLQLVKPGGGKPVPVDLRQVVRETITLMAHPISDAKITVIEQLPEQEVLVVVDGHYLKQLVLNLVLNAIDAMRSSFRKELLFRIRAQSGQVYLDVADTGSGIPPEILPRIFDPFFTSKPTETSRGLGLSVSRSLAKQYQGEILVETAVGEGSIFTLRLPQSRPRATVAPVDAPAVIADALAGSEEARPPEILVVDDEENVGNLVKEILRRKLKGNVRRALNGEEAIAEIEKADFDLIVSDVRMPVKNGLELFRWISANRPDSVPRFLFMTGHDGTNDMSDEIARSQVPVLRKPFAVDALIQQCQARLAAAGGLRKPIP